MRWYRRPRQQPWYLWDVYVMNADGRGQRRLARDTWLAAPVWSPDGQESPSCRQADELHVVSADGSGERKLTAARHARHPGLVARWGEDRLGTQLRRLRHERRRHRVVEPDPAAPSASSPLRGRPTSRDRLRAQARTKALQPVQQVHPSLDLRGSRHQCRWQRAAAAVRASGGGVDPRWLPMDTTSLTGIHGRQPGDLRHERRRQWAAEPVAQSGRGRLLFRMVAHEEAVTVTAPPRPPHPSDPVDREELEALVEALIEEARQRHASPPSRILGSSQPSSRSWASSRSSRSSNGGAQSQTASPALSARSIRCRAGGDVEDRLFGRCAQAPPSGGFLQTELYVMNADGSGMRRLVRHASGLGPSHRGGPVWSPDGLKLAFEKRLGPAIGQCGVCHTEIFVANADGSGTAEPHGQPRRRRPCLVARRAADRVLEHSRQLLDPQPLRHECRRKRAAPGDPGRHPCLGVVLVARRAAACLRELCRRATLATSISTW